MDVVVVGGGVIGLSIAYALSKRGVAASVIDRDDLGKGASWAGAGMLPPFVERQDSSPMNALRSWSAVLYREWSTELREATGIDNGYRVTGGIDVAITPKDTSDLKTAAGRWRVEGIRAESLGVKEIARIEPGLTSDLTLAYYVPDRAQVRNPWHLRALEEAIRKAGVTLLKQRKVMGFVRKGDRVTGIETNRGRVNCGMVVMAAGAWTGALLDTVQVALPTPPLKGQILLYQTKIPIVRHIIEHGKMYLVPREDGHVLMGSTEEDAGFDLRTTAEAERDLRAEAERLFPSLATEAKVERIWAGLRPGSIDTRPYIGRVPGLENLIVASGHKRAGLQLSTATAEVVADLILDATPRIDLAYFAPDRQPAASEDLAFRS